MLESLHDKPMACWLEWTRIEPLIIRVRLVKAFGYAQIAEIDGDEMMSDAA
jgi:hypothetical protein